MALEISPQELEFQKPFMELRHQPLTITNTGNEILVYKVKTTSPKLYCVRPNSAAVEAGQSLEIAITRQAKDVAPGEQSKDKFLILYVPTDTETLHAASSVGQLWTQIESNEASAPLIRSKKIKVVYREASSSASAASEKHHGEAAGVASLGAGAAAGTAAAGPVSPVNTRAAVQATAGESTNSPTTPYRDTSSPVSHAKSPSGSTGHASIGHASGSSAPHSEGPVLTVDDIQGTPGIPRKSQIVDEGTAKTGPRLANSNLPNGPSGDLGSSEEEHHGGHTTSHIPAPETAGKHEKHHADEAGAANGASSERANESEVADNRFGSGLKGSNQSKDANVSLSGQDSSSYAQKAQDSVAAASGAFGAAASGIGATVGGIFGGDQSSGNDSKSAPEAAQGRQTLQSSKFGSNAVSDIGRKPVHTGTSDSLADINSAKQQASGKLNDVRESTANSTGPAGFSGGSQPSTGSKGISRGISNGQAGASDDVRKSGVDSVGETKLATGSSATSASGTASFVGSRAKDGSSSATSGPNSSTSYGSSSTLLKGDKMPEESTGSEFSCPLSNGQQVPLPTAFAIALIAFVIGWKLF